jgi:hypothetical protein
VGVIFKALFERYLVRSCTHHVGADVKGTFDYLHDDLLLPIYDDILMFASVRSWKENIHGVKKKLSYDDCP